MRKIPLLAVLPAAAVFAMLAAAPASADSTQTFQNRATGKCLDAHNNSGWTVYVHDCNGGDNQKWIVHTWNDGTKQIGNKAIAGLCLGVNPANNNVGAWGCNSDPDTSWFTDNTSRGVRFKSQLTGTCFDTNGSSIYLHDCIDDDDYQRWY